MKVGWPGDYRIACGEEEGKLMLCVRMRLVLRAVIAYIARLDPDFFHHFPFFPPLPILFPFSPFLRRLQFFPQLPISSTAYHFFHRFPSALPWQVGNVLPRSSK